MKRFVVLLVSFTLSSSVSFARPFGGVAVRDINICNFASAVAINATGAANAVNQLDVSLDNNWIDITHVGNDPQLSISSVAWPGFPQVNCEFQGVDTAPVLNNGITTDSGVTFQAKRGGDMSSSGFAARAQSAGDQWNNANASRRGDFSAQTSSVNTSDTGTGSTRGWFSGWFSGKT